MNIARKIASVFLLLVLLTTSTGFSLYTAFCQMTGESYSSVIIENHCCCPDTDSADMCCDQEAEYVQLDFESSVSALQINVDTHFFVAWIQYQVNQLFQDKDLNPSKYFNYRPPLIERNIPVLVQSFLL
ncbi:MAG: hypothetical protein WD426_15220 [Anditalea sp.]